MGRAEKRGVSDDGLTLSDRAAVQKHEAEFILALLLRAHASGVAAGLTQVLS
jgi:hypothetical protein